MKNRDEFIEHEKSKNIRVTINITNESTYELYSRFLNIVKNSRFATQQNAIEHALYLGMEQLLVEEETTKKNLFEFIDETGNKYKNFLLKSLDLRFLNLIKHSIVNEKKINLLLNCLAESKIIDNIFFLESKESLQLTEDSPWVSQLKKDLDSDFNQINIKDFVKEEK
ncbi:hypothetical protein [Spiroplasma endosymbiont of Aspidapion aeneum]|uniref:hypothetical protein n=1 Tax=Spiroplasma endosymbiont of Aspidapion aeneum TaxID=3066276 RepID=UPI00313C83CD